MLFSLRSHQKVTIVSAKSPFHVCFPTLNRYIVQTESRNVQTGFCTKYRHNLRISIVITRTSKQHQKIAESIKSIPDLVFLRVYYIDNIDGSTVLQTSLDTSIGLESSLNINIKPWESFRDIWKQFGKIIRNYRIKAILLHCAPPPG